MSNGYLVAARADLATARELGEGFELDVLELAAVGDGAIPMLTNAANVGILLSAAGTRDAGFFALVQKLSMQLPRAQLIIVDPQAPTMFGFFPPSWPAMPIEEALRRAHELTRRRAAPMAPAPQEPVHAAPLPPSAPEQIPQAPPAIAEHQAAPAHEHIEPVTEPEFAPPPTIEDDRVRGITIEPQHSSVDDAPLDAPAEILEEPADAVATTEAAEPPPPMPPLRVDPPEEFGGEPPAALQEDVSLEAPATAEPASEALEIEPTPAWKESAAEQSAEPPLLQAAPAPAPMQSNSYGSGPARSRGEFGQSGFEAGRRGAAASYTADASAFAPKKLRRDAPELLRVVIHQPHQLKEVMKTAKKMDPRAEAAPQGVRVGDVAVGESVGVSLDVRGASCDGALQRRVWNGEPIDFSFTLEAETDVKQAVILARVFVGDAQVGVIAFTRRISGPSKKAAADERLKLKRHKHVFLSYSSQDRETVSTIATAYAAAGISYFWDRSSLKSGEEWSPRLRKEIDKADLFHLCWSKSASKSEWVVTEAEHALTRRRKSNGKYPDITVQMLDGPPWAPHPLSLDSINFDDFVRAAIVGYARGDGDPG
ncbi:MAG: TIR domain-containing protein [Terricaulis sp.]